MLDRKRFLVTEYLIGLCDQIFSPISNEFLFDNDKCIFYYFSKEIHVRMLVLALQNIVMMEQPILVISFILFVY
jgi:hypothetical protein